MIRFQTKFSQKLFACRIRGVFLFLYATPNKLIGNTPQFTFKTIAVTIKKTLLILLSYLLTWLANATPLAQYLDPLRVATYSLKNSGL